MWRRRRVGDVFTSDLAKEVRPTRFRAEEEEEEEEEEAMYSQANLLKEVRPEEERKRTMP